MSRILSSIEVYNNKADFFEQQYLSVAAEDVHQAWLSRYLPQQGIALDVGAGIGRDAKYLAENSLTVVAVEPGVLRPVLVLPRLRKRQAPGQ